MLTNVRTRVQFSQYGEVKTFIYNGNKLQARNHFHGSMGINEFTMLIEYLADSWLPKEQFTKIDPTDPNPR